MTLDDYLPEHAKAVSAEPCPATGRAAVPDPVIRFVHRTVHVPEFEDQLHAATVARHALAMILHQQAAACERRADMWTFNAIDPVHFEDFTRQLLTFLHVAWSDFEYRYTLKPNHPQNALQGALVVPYWAAAVPMFGLAAVQHNLPIITTMWDRIDGPPTETPSGTVLVLHSRNHMAPSLLEQNYDVVAVHPFNVARGAAA